MDFTNVEQSKSSTLVPVSGLSFFAVASGFLMSLIPLSLPSFGLSESLVPWLASIFYLGILIGATSIQNLVSRTGHRIALILFLSALILTIIAMLLMPDAVVWLIARFVAGFAVAGIFVVIESWLLMADSSKQRAKRLGLYMTSLYGGSALGQLAIAPVGISGIAPYLAVICLLMLAILPPLLIKRGQPSCEQHQKMKLSELKGISRPAILGCLVSGLLLGPIYGLMPVYINNQVQSTDQTGMLMAVIILGGMLVQPLVSHLSSRISKSLLMAQFCLFGTLGIIGVLEAQSFVIIATSYLVLGACSFALYPIAITLACDALPVEKIVSATEIMLLSYSVGSVVGPLFAANLSDSPDGIIFYLGACLITTCIYMLIKSMQKAHGEQWPLSQ
ncbi:MFS transporter [Shewanella canadensis]|uniref:MFS transporter n=1 Tax=Shewanella canadensis TaxID=271096 RepID=A0A431WYN0_9GAMM|nr:MFS transporter [Shewanella canadensis]RTR40596.1 MFS transporter [Shewanella canadensis]